MTGLATIIISGQNWVLPAILVVAALVAAVSWAARHGSTERSVRIGCGLLKLTGVLLLALCLLEPLWVGQRARPGANIFALVADNSSSMQIKDATQTQSRGGLLQQELTNDARGWQSALAENFQVRRYTFDSRWQSTRDFSELNLSGSGSALGRALQTATENWRGQPVAGVLLFTDGNATDLAGDLPHWDGCPPIYPVVMGQDTGLRDISLNKVMSSQTAFEDAPVTIQAEVAANGFAGADIVVRLTEIATSAASVKTNDSDPKQFRVLTTSNVVAQSTQHATGDDTTLDFRFQIQPDKPGLHFYEVEARARDELDKPATPSREATLVNNRQVVVVDRGQEPFRILYVCGRPNWEYKFFHRAIQEDSLVQMVGLIRVARREPKFEFKGKAGEASNPLFRGFGRPDEETVRYDQPVLIRLDTKDEFELRGGFPKTADELFRYQAVVIGDLEAEFFTHDQMALLQRFVSERGGGFLMLGGAESFREGNYAGTPAASMLPVYLDRPGDAKLPSEYKLSLTREGWLQPWTRLRATEAEERTRLDAVPRIDVYNPVGGIKPGASVLATVADDSGATFPALVVQRFGLGRTAAMLVGNLWEAGMKDESMQKDLAKSWRQLARWLVSDVPPVISVTAQTSANGDPTAVRLTVQAHDEEFKPMDNATVHLIIRPVRLASPPSESSALNGLDTSFLDLTADASATTAGTYEATYIARQAGAYSVEAVVTQSDGALAGRAATGWTSDPAAAEFHSLKPNRALLENIAHQTGGQVIAMADLPSFVRSLPQRHAPITETWTQPLWHKPLVFLLVLLCFVTEWGLRRWKGLP